MLSANYFVSSAMDSEDVRIKSCSYFSFLEKLPKWYKRWGYVRSS